MTHELDGIPYRLAAIALVAHDCDDVLDELAAMFERPAWMADAACKEHPREWWHPPRGGSTRNVHRAKEVCAGCLVRDECLDYALEHENTGWCFGIWGGLSPNQRRPLVQRGHQVVERRCVECDEPFEVRAWTDQPRCRPCARRYTVRMSMRRTRGTAA